MASTAPPVLDLNFLGQPGVIASFAFSTPDGLALVDPGPSSTLPALRSGLARLGLDLGAVRHILLTHIHLDHAGSAGTLLAELPQARAYVHARGAAHLQTPARLLSSAAQIYGERMDALWGEMRPVQAAQLTVLEGGETLDLGGLEVEAIYTPGHAVHHLAYAAGPELFVGDVGGIRLDPLQSPRAPTPPPDIDLAAWERSIEVLRERDAARVHLSHFGSYPQRAAHWDGLMENMTADADLVRRCLEAGEDAQTIAARYTGELMADLGREGPGLPARFEFACPPSMSVQGLIRYWGRRERAAGARL